jgi:hypothetical protein
VNVRGEIILGNEGFSWRTVVYIGHDPSADNVTGVKSRAQVIKVIRKPCDYAERPPVNVVRVTLADHLIIGLENDVGAFYVFRRPVSDWISQDESSVNAIICDCTQKTHQRPRGESTFDNFNCGDYGINIRYYILGTPTLKRLKIF